MTAAGGTPASRNRPHLQGTEAAGKLYALIAEPVLTCCDPSLAVCQVVRREPNWRFGQNDLY
jgi:hypothetical protein